MGLPAVAGLRAWRAAVALCPLLLILSALPASAQISAEEFAARRSALLDELGDGIYYFEGAGSPANDYSPWGQDAYFHYLTGFEEPGARLLMVKSGADAREILFVRDRDPGREIWEGYRLGPEGAAEQTGMECHSLADFDDVLRSATRNAPRAVISMRTPADHEIIASLLGTIGRARGRGRGRAGAGATPGGAGVTWIDPSGALRRMRSIKSPAEIELLQTASTITRQAHLAAMRAAEPGMNEFEIQALIEYSFRRYGAARPGFASIVGSGQNSTVLHYNANDRFMEEGDTLVMDIGAEYGRYTTDITRTIPVSGKFTPEQREIYDIVLEAQLAAEEVAKEIGVSSRDLSRAATQVISEGLARLGLIESADATLPGSGRPQYRLFFMHGLGHGIGLNVHDPNSPTVEIGYAFTIEPGLYIRADALDRIGEGPEADALRAKLRPAILKYQNIGVRIEDSYAYTEKGLVRLSAGIPRTADEVEATMAEDSPTSAGRLEELVERYRKLKRERRE